MSFSNLPKDIRFKIALGLSPADLVHFCAVEKKQYSDVCSSKIFWRQKLALDYPGRYTEHEYKDSPKEKYIEEFTRIFREIEKFVEVYIEKYFGKFRKHLASSYKKDLERYLYKVYLTTMENLKKQGYTPDDIDYVEELGDDESMILWQEDHTLGKLDSYDYLSDFILKLLRDEWKN